MKHLIDTAGAAAAALTRLALGLCIALSFAPSALHCDELFCDAKRIIGAKAMISLPQLRLEGIMAKVDTGAWTSSLSCSSITVDPSGRWVEFVPLRGEKSFKMPLVRTADVKSSNAAVEKRPFVKLQVLIGGTPYETEFSLTDRSGMKHHVLLGRQLLRNRFVVDVAR